MKEEDLVQRISELISLKTRGSVSAFSRIIGLSQTTLNNYMIRRRKISLEVCTNILEEFPDVSAEWLLRGEGPMFHNSASSPSNVNNFELSKNKAVGNHNNVGDTTSATPDLVNKLLDQNAQLIEIITKINK